MCEAAVTIVLIPAASHKFNRYLVVVQIVPNLFERPVQKERRDRIAHRDVTTLCETDRHTDHELFARADINRPVGKVAPNIVQDTVAQIGRKQEDLRVGLHSPVKHSRKLLAH